MDGILVCSVFRRPEFMHKNGNGNKAKACFHFLGWGGRIRPQTLSTAFRQLRSAALQTVKCPQYG